MKVIYISSIYCNGCREGNQYPIDWNYNQDHFEYDENVFQYDLLDDVNAFDEEYEKINKFEGETEELENELAPACHYQHQGADMKTYLFSNFALYVVSLLVNLN